MRRFFMVAAALAIVGCGGLGGTGLTFDTNGPFRIVSDPPMARLGSSTRFYAFGLGSNPNQWAWRTIPPSPRMAANGTYTPTDLGLDSVIADNPDHQGVASNRLVRTIPAVVSIVFASDNSGQSEIWTINEDGTGLTQWTSDGGRDPVGATGADRFYYKKGQELWLTGFLGGVPSTGLYRGFNSELEPIGITHKWNGALSCEPFVVWRHNPIGGPVEYHVTTQGGSGTAFLLVTELTIDSLDNGNNRWVASVGEPGSRQLYLLDQVAFRGTGMTQLTFGTLDCREPSNGLDGRSVYFAGHDGTQWDVYVFDETSGVATNLTNTPGLDEEHPRVSPEGSRLVFSRGVAGSREIWTMKTDGKDKRPLVTGLGDCVKPDYLVIAAD